MKISSAVIKSLTILFLALPSTVFAMTDDDPILSKLMSEFEFLPSENESALEWDIDAWVGRDLNKVWLKSSGELSEPLGSGSELDSANIELVISRAAYINWDQQFGIRHDVASSREDYARNWLSFGFIGTAPYFFAVDARVFIGEESSTQLLVEIEREIMLTQEWVLTPELDIVSNGRSNKRFDEGSGLAEIEFSLRLGYEANGNRKLQPFIGISGRQLFGGTRRINKSQGEESSELEVMLGIHSWF